MAKQKAKRKATRNDAPGSLRPVSAAGVSRKDKREADVAQLSILCRCLSDANLAATGLQQRCRQFDAGESGNASQIASLASEAAETLDRAISIVMRQIEGGVAHFLAPWRGEPVESWLPRILDGCNEALEVARSYASQSADPDGLGSFKTITRDIRLACAHVATIQCLRSAGIPQHHSCPVVHSPNLTERESNILEALGDKTMTADEIATASGYRNNSWFRELLSQMVKRGLLVRVDGRGGYRRA